MRHAFAVMLLAYLSASLASCNFDSGMPWHYGPYALMWIDRPDDVWLEYRYPDGGSHRLVEPRVFAVGADQQWVVAKQHPNGDRSVTNFYVIEATPDAIPAQNHEFVRGPFTEAQFQQLVRELALPSFSKVLASLQ